MTDNSDQTSASSELEDDESISGDTLLYRRVLNQQNPPVRQIVWDENRNCWRPSSAAFTNHPDGSGMSVGIDDTYKELDIEPTTILNGHPNFSLTAFPTKAVREKNQKTIRKPLDGDPAHGEVIGKKTKSVKNAIIANCFWVVEPDIKPE